jgi:hypothetical protein
MYQLRTLWWRSHAHAPNSSRVPMAAMTATARRTSANVPTDRITSVRLIVVARFIYLLLSLLQYRYVGAAVEVPRQGLPNSHKLFTAPTMNLRHDLLPSAISSSPRIGEGYPHTNLTSSTFLVGAGSSAPGASARCEPVRLQRGGQPAATVPSYFTGGMRRSGHWICS